MVAIVSWNAPRTVSKVCAILRRRAMHLSCRDSIRRCGSCLARREALPGFVFNLLSVSRVATVTPVSVAVSRSAHVAALPAAAIVVLAGVSPFEIPLLDVSGRFTLTTVEMAVLFALGVTAAVFALGGRQLVWRTP